MTRPPDREIRELVNDLYRRLDIASRPRCAEARLLEQIGLAADALMDDTDDPRVAALAADLAAVVAYARIIERYAKVSPLTPWIGGLRAEAGVQRIMEATEYVPSGTISTRSVDLHNGKPIRRGER